MDKYFAFSLHKAGSTLFYNLLHNAAHRSQRIQCNKAMTYVSIPDRLFNAGIPESVLLEKGFVSPVGLDEKDTIYGGFRFVPEFVGEPLLKNSGVMILVRDPRDVLTSLYYSVVKSHRVPDGASGRQMQDFRESAARISIDDFVLEQARHGQWADRLDRISSLRGLGKAWRYEDIVFDKARWFDEMLEYLELDLPRAARADLVKREDIRPEGDQPDEHVRQVTPGDHRRKLAPATIQQLDAVFDRFLHLWDYKI